MKTDTLYQSPGQDAAPKHERPWRRFLAAAKAPALDRELAAGCPPQSRAALTIRAREIVSAAERRQLARRWASVLDEASRAPFPLSSRALRRRAVQAAADDVRQMIAVLTGGLPIEARGAAMASSLLSDGSGPLYNPRSSIGLGTAIREATCQMDRSV